MSWSLLTNGITASPRNGKASDVGDGESNLDGDPGTEPAGSIAAGCAVLDELPSLGIIRLLWRAG